MLRSLLFLPGNDPNMLVNGDVLGADGVIFDLEDAVAPDQKDAARVLVRHVLGFLDYSRVAVIVRINPIDSGTCWQKDLDEIVPLKPDMIMPTKVGGPEDIKTVSDYIGAIEERRGLARGTVKLLPLIETARGIENAGAIAAADGRIAAIFLGAEDLTADMRCKRTPGGGEIAYARSRVVIAARAAGVEPIDTPFTDINDDEGIKTDALLAKSLGFSGKAAISPRHVGVINQVFSPSPEEIEYAGEVMAAIKRGEALGKGAVSLRGKMIDKPVAVRAAQILEMAGRLKAGREYADEQGS